MKVFVYVAVTANGLITIGTDNVDWVSEASWNSYLKVVTGADAVIVGRRTYEAMGKDEFVEGVSYFVLSSQHQAKPSRSNAEYTNKKPTELIAELKAQKIKTVAVCGGAQTITSCLEAGVVDELFLDIEPIISGSGKNLITSSIDQLNLQLLDTKQLGDSTIQLHYNVTK